MKNLKRVYDRYRNSVLPMFFYCFLTAFGLNAPMAFLPTFVTRMGMTAAELGILMAFRPIAMIVGQFIWGRVADRARSVNSVLMILMFGTVGSSVVFLFATNFYIMLTAIVGYYFFYSAIYPLMDTISMDMVARGQLSSYGNVRIMTTLGYILSVSLTGTLSGINPSFMFIVVIGVGVLSILFLFQVEKTESKRVKGMKFNSAKFFMQKVVMVPLLTYLVLQFVYSSFDIVFPVYISINLGAGDGIYGYSMALRVFGECLVLPFINKITKRISFKTAIILFIMLSVLRFAITGLTTNIMALLFVSILSGIGNIGSFTWVMMYINELAPPEGKATVQSTMWMMFSIAQVGGNLITGLVMPDSTVGVGRWYFFACAGIMALSAVVYSLYKTDKKVESKRVRSVKGTMRRLLKQRGKIAAAQALAARRAAETQQAAGTAAQNTDAFTADDAPAADSDHKQ